MVVEKLQCVGHAYIVSVDHLGSRENGTALANSRRSLLQLQLFEPMIQFLQRGFLLRFNHKSYFNSTQAITFCLFLL